MDNLPSFLPNATDGRTRPAPAVSAYPAPAPLPTQSGPCGIRFDFNDGCRVALPRGDSPWHVVLRDRLTGNILFDTELDEGLVVSAKRYAVPFRIEISQSGREVFTHDQNCADQAVHIAFPVGTLGDILGWFPYAAHYQEIHRCRLTCSMAANLIPLFAATHPEITFLDHDAVDTGNFYATYYLGLFFNDDERRRQPCDFRLVGLHRTAGYILGVDPTETPPRIARPAPAPKASSPYVCIAVQSTAQAKMWNNPEGWHTIVAFLKDRGYRVVCIDQKRVGGSGMVWTHIPHGVEDMTGDHPLLERAELLRGAALFVGLSSGLSWLAWAVGTPVVMISGFTHPLNEFATPYRVINYHACNSCWNDPRVAFDHKDFLWCPHHAGTPRQFECTRLITAEHVIGAISTVPGFDSNPTHSQPTNHTTGSIA